jgi:hypothetical protein
VARDGQDHRRAPRRPVLGHAVIRAPALEASCIVRDLSASGAKIEVPSSVDLPQEFNLMLAEAKTSRHVHLRWRAGNFAGVEFDRSSEASASVVSGEGDAPPSKGPVAEKAAPLRTAGKGGPEKRKASRRPVLGHCVILTSSTRVSAVVRDISAGGAKLNVPKDVQLPSEFYLGDPKSRSVRKVLLRWRDGDFAGVEFCTSPASAAEKQLARDLESAWFV